jgi:hypothetical protein
MDNPPGTLSSDMRASLMVGLTAVVAAVAIAVILFVVGQLHFCVFAAARGLPGLSVSGNQLLAGDRPIRAMGVNRSGTEYACVQGFGIFDGPSDEASVAAIASWHVNFVRIPLNEDCWLGINRGEGNPAYYGEPYRKAIQDFVALLHEHGIYAELSLMWAAPGDYPATYQSGGPDADHSPVMWESMATTFKDDGGVILAPWGETIVGWKCFRDGCNDQATFGPKNTPYQTAGMQQAVDVMRKAGYKGPVSIPCIAYANRCADYNKGSWLEYQPKDPLRQIVAEAHVYGKNACDSIACFDQAYAPIAAKVPMIWGETGESYDNSDCGTGWISAATGWAERHGVGYMAWAWNTWNDRCSVLISSYDGTPTPHGAWYKQHFAERAALAQPTPLPRHSPAARQGDSPSSSCA